MVVLLPIAGVEGIDNVTIAPWYLLFAGFWLLLWRPTRLASAVSSGFLLWLCALSTVGVLVLLPLWLLRLIAIRDRRDTIIVTALAVGIAIQLGLSWNTRDVIGQESSTPFLVIDPISHALVRIVPPVHLSDTPFGPHWDWSIVPAYAQRVVGGAVTGQVITGHLWEQLGTPFELLLSFGLVAFVFFAIARNDPRTRVFVPLTVAMSLALFLLSGVARGTGSLFHWPHGSSNDDLSHYAIVPTLLLLSALFVQLDVSPKSLPSTVWKNCGRGWCCSCLSLRSLRSTLAIRPLAVRPNGRLRSTVAVPSVLARTQPKSKSRSTPPYLAIACLSHAVSCGKRGARTDGGREFGWLLGVRHDRIRPMAPVDLENREGWTRTARSPFCWPGPARPSDPGDTPSRAARPKVCRPFHRRRRCAHGENFREGSTCARWSWRRAAAQRVFSP